MHHFFIEECGKRGDKRIQCLQHLFGCGLIPAGIALHIGRQLGQIVGFQRFLGIEMVANHIFQRGVSAVVQPGPGQRHIAQWRWAKSITVGWISSFTETAEIGVRRFSALAGPNLGSGDVMVLLICEQPATVTANTSCLAVEKERPLLGLLQ